MAQDEVVKSKSYLEPCAAMDDQQLDGDAPQQRQRVENISVLTPEQLASLNQAKVMIRMDNEQYLRDHPDVNKIMRALVRGIIRDRPTNPSTYAYRYFQRPEDAIRKDLDSKE